MIAVDTNVLIYAHRSDSAFHAKARQCVASLAEGRAGWAIPWPCLHEFLAIVSHPRVFSPPTRLVDAIAQVDAWLASPSITTLDEDEGYWAVLCELLKVSRVTGARIHDARIAALCLLHGVRELWTADRDFTRFPDLVTVNPLLLDGSREAAPIYGALRRRRALRRSGGARPT